MKINFSFTLIVVLILFTSSCTKEEGEGGTSTIRGKLLVMHLNGSQQFDTSYYGSDEDIFIIYGQDHSTYDDNFKTSYDGSFEFEFLQEGTYRIFAYSTDTAGLAAGQFIENQPDVPIFRTVEITGRKQTVEVPDLVIIKYN